MVFVRAPSQIDPSIAEEAHESPRPGQRNQPALAHRERDAIPAWQDSLDVAIAGHAHARVAAPISHPCVVESPGEDDGVLRPCMIVERYDQTRLEPYEPSIDGGSNTRVEAKAGDMLLQDRMSRLREQFGRAPEDLNLDLGPLGPLLPR